MSLCYRERLRLVRIRSALRRSDPHLAAMLAVFAWLEAGQPLPGWEQIGGLLTRFRCGLLWTVSRVADLVARAAGALSRRLRRAARVHAGKGAG